MKTKLYILIFIFVGILSSCSNSELSTTTYKSYKLPDETTYSKIIREIILQDTLNFDKRFIKNKCFSKNLSKLCVVGLKPKTDSIYMQQTADTNFETNLRELNYFNSRSTFRMEIDTLYFSFQNESAKQISINNNIIDFVNLCPDSTIRQNQSYYQFSLPLLNKKQNKAIVICRNHCDGCGYIEVYLVEKINSKWTIRYRQTPGEN